MRLTQTEPPSKEGRSRTVFGRQLFCRLRRRFSTWSLVSVTLSIFYVSALGNAGAQVTILYSFGSGQPTEGVGPGGGLILAANGSFYGATGEQLGNVGSMFPAGTIFQFEPTTGEITYLESFPDQGPHISPETPLLLFKGGLIGVTYGTNKSHGIIFDLSSSGNLDLWHKFGKGDPFDDGRNPLAPLIVGPNGHLYGVTNGGGRYNYGAFYKLNPATREVTIVYSLPPAGLSCPPAYYWQRMGFSTGLLLQTLET